mmetsp:Transcript_4313/g.12839  ORF Transcript_4313/g.12839 Transcript_4313/m.12839 type:complete len:273 (+) Transcript_4313:872-1690(+)
MRSNSSCPPSTEAHALPCPVPCSADAGFGVAPVGKVRLGRESLMDGALPEAEAKRAVAAAAAAAAMICSSSKTSKSPSLTDQPPTPTPDRGSPGCAREKRVFGGRSVPTATWDRASFEDPESLRATVIGVARDTAEKSAFIPEAVAAPVVLGAGPEVPAPRGPWPSPPDPVEPRGLGVRSKLGANPSPAGAAPAAAPNAVLGAGVEPPRPKETRAIDRLSRDAWYDPVTRMEPAYTRSTKEGTRCTISCQAMARSSKKTSPVVAGLSQYTSA